MNAIVQATNGGPETHTIAERLVGLIEAGEVHAVIDRHKPLTDLADPHRYVETGRKVGNVIVDVT